MNWPRRVYHIACFSQGCQPPWRFFCLAFRRKKSSYYCRRKRSPRQGYILFSGISLSLSLSVSLLPTFTSLYKTCFLSRASLTPLLREPIDLRSYIIHHRPLTAAKRIYYIAYLNIVIQGRCSLLLCQELWPCVLWILTMQASKLQLCCIVDLLGPYWTSTATEPIPCKLRGLDKDANAERSIIFQSKWLPNSVSWGFQRSWVKDMSRGPTSFRIPERLTFFDISTVFLD